MPTYEYRCRNCGFETEELQSFTEEPLKLCPACHTESLSRILGGGAGLIFKGSGFYLTDYRKDAKKSGGEKKEEKKPENKVEPPKPSGGAAKE
jgi:putative FmdB family regulatory protein